jgi:phospholipid transport system substrate-binding protein
MRERLLKLVPAITLALVLGLPQARALDTKDPAALINSLVNEGIAQLKQTEEPPSVRAANFRALLEAGFDIPVISRFVLGRYWRAASDAERREFATLFEDWVVRTYASRFKSYAGQTIRVTGTRPESEMSTVVLSQFVNPNAPDPVRVEWHVRKEPGGSYKIYDISVEGVSMALTERDEIAAVADRNGGTAAALNRVLEQRLAATATASK